MPRFLVVALLAAAAGLACAAFGDGAPLDPEILEPLLARTEAARGRELPRPVEARVLLPGQVRRLLARELAGALEPGEVERSAEAARALGLLPAGVDLERALLDFGVEGLGGFYTPLWNRLYVVDVGATPWGPWRRPSPRPRNLEPGVLVHELAHALQAAHTPLGDVTLGLREQDDLAFAIGALLEGDALWTSHRDEELRLRTPPPTEEAYAADMGAAFAEAAWPGVPRLVREPLVLQYPLGYALARRVSERGGAAALDAALAAPPLSSEQLLHPELWLEPATRDAPTFLTLPETPPPGCAPLAGATLGELGLRIWLAERRGAGSARESPAAGWDGDRVLTWRCAGGVAFAWWLRFDGAVDAEEFAVVAEDAVSGLGPGLAGAPGVARDGSDVWISAGLAEPERARLRAQGRAQVYPDLDAFLADHPDVLERARARRAAAPAP